MPPPPPPLDSALRMELEGLAYFSLEYIASGGFCHVWKAEYRPHGGDVELRAVRISKDPYEHDKVTPINIALRNEFTRRPGISDGTEHRYALQVYDYKFLPSEPAEGAKYLVVLCEYCESNLWDRRRN